MASLSRSDQIVAVALILPIAVLSAACEEAEESKPGSAGAAALGCPAGLPGAALVRIKTGDGSVYCMEAMLMLLEAALEERDR